jgi:L-lactate dehydrogenase complex protein LldG
VPAVRAFAEAFRRAGGEVVLLPDEGAAEGWLADFTDDVSGVAVGGGVPAGLRPAVRELPPAEADVGISVARGAAADTGTLLLGSEGGRGAQLLPPVHLVWVDARTVHATLAEAMERAREAGLPAALGLHSGPSKSADIGRIVVTGVHGPGRVVAAIIGAEEEDPVA